MQTLVCVCVFAFTVCRAGSIPLCQAETIVAGQPTYYLSRNTPASATTLSAACPDPSTLANDPANAETVRLCCCVWPVGTTDRWLGQQITAKIPSSYFIPGATYTTMAYYSSEGGYSHVCLEHAGPCSPSLRAAARIDIRTNDSYAFLNVEVVGEFPEQSTAPENRRLEAVHDSPAGTHAVGPRRRLLKGGFGGGGYSGPSYRTRYGKRNYFGSTVHRRRYGRYGPRAVGSDTVVLVRGRLYVGVCAGVLTLLLGGVAAVFTRANFQHPCCQHYHLHRVDQQCACCCCASVVDAPWRVIHGLHCVECCRRAGTPLRAASSPCKRR